VPGLRRPDSRILDTTAHNDAGRSGVQEPHDLDLLWISCRHKKGKGKGSPYSITERRVPELIRVCGSQPACDVSHKPDGRLPLSARPAVTLTTLKRAATSFAAC